MRRSLRPALEADRPFCESLNRSNMSAYRAARGISWDRQRYLAGWARFETMVISVDGQLAGMLQLAMVDEALEIRDLQVVPAYRGLGLGAWAVGQAGSMALARGIGLLRLRVYEENPARRLYTRLGFVVESIDSGTVHMSCALLPEQPAVNDADRKRG